MFPLTLGPSFIERRSMASRFSKETTICMVERWNKGMGYCFVPDCNHAKESHTCQFFFRFFFLCRTCRSTVCCDPEILFPWLHDVTTSSLYSSPSPLLSRPPNPPNKLMWDTKHDRLPLEADWFAPNNVDSPNVTIEWMVTIETKASLEYTVKWTCKEA